jgi:hypothetical protein
VYVQRVILSCDHNTQGHTTIGRTPLDEGWAHRRNLVCLTTIGIFDNDPSGRIVCCIKQTDTKCHVFYSYLRRHAILISSATEAPIIVFEVFCDFSSVKEKSSIVAASHQVTICFFCILSDSLFTNRLTIFVSTKKWNAVLLSRLSGGFICITLQIPTSDLIKSASPLASHKRRIPCSCWACFASTYFLDVQWLYRGLWSVVSFLRRAFGLEIHVCVAAKKCV